MHRIWTRIRKTMLSLLHLHDDRFAFITKRSGKMKRSRLGRRWGCVGEVQGEAWLTSLSLLDLRFNSFCLFYSFCLCFYLPILRCYLSLFPSLLSHSLLYPSRVFCSRIFSAVVMYFPVPCIVLSRPVSLPPPHPGRLFLHLSALLTPMDRSHTRTLYHQSRYIYSKQAKHPAMHIKSVHWPPLLSMVLQALFAFKSASINA